MKYQEVTGGDPVVGWQQLRKLDFDVVRIFGGRPAKALCQAGNVGIDDHRRNLEGGAEDDVGGLAADAGEGGQIAQSGRNFALVALDQTLGTADEMAGLGMVKAGGADQRFDLGRICLTEGGGIRIAGKETGGDEVDTLVGTLGRKDGGNQEFKGGTMRQGTLGGRIKFCQPVEEDGRGAR